MNQNIAVISSDLSGATGSVVQFANCGANARVYLDESRVQDCDVVGLTTNSKLASARRAYNNTRHAIKRCKGRHIYLKEDSALKGNLPSTIQAVIDELNPRKLLICISIPEKHRHVQGGKVYFRGVPIDQTTIYNDPLSPVTEGHIPTLLYKSIGIKSEVLGFDIIDKGPEAVLRHIMDSKERIVVLDALESQHFRNIAAAIQLGGDECFTCMADSLARELPFIYGYSRDKLNAIRPLSNKKPVLTIIGSYDPIAGMQLHSANTQIGLPVIRLETIGLLPLKNRKGILEEYRDKIIAILKTGNNCAITSSGSRIIPQLRYKMAYLLAEIAVEAYQTCNVGALVIAGSDTMYALCDTLCVQRINVLGSIRTNVSTTISRLHMRNGSTLYLGSRGGGTGVTAEIQKTLEVLRPNIAI